MSEINRENKDRLFRFIFGNEENKAWTLSLYNAVNGTSYQNPDDIIITTIQDALYMGMKDDIAILVYATMNMFEQQSTFNPNLPLRYLIYAGMIYSGLIESGKWKINLYSSKIQRLPVPKCVCFYNGIQEKDDMILELSSAFPENSDPDIQVRVHMLNINYGRNEALLNACAPLRDYSFLIYRIRFHQNNGMEIGDAVDLAVDELSDDSVIKPFIMKNRAEVKRMCITEYDEVKTMNMFREEGYNEGRTDGYNSGRADGQFQSLASLAKKHYITVEQAAEEAGMTVDEFLKKMKLV
ncbi:MAG: hypothetical protein II969_04215 [Anaerolineaceae bacterium]|nr:hypothetical protein [Anaerolineaceae bacterium]